MSGLHRNCHPDTIDIETDLALIAVVGRAMKSNRGTAGRIFSALAHAHVNVKMIDQGSSELNIIIGVNEADFESAKQLLLKFQLPVSAVVYYSRRFLRPTPLHSLLLRTKAAPQLFPHGQVSPPH